MVMVMVIITTINRITGVGDKIAHTVLVRSRKSATPTHDVKPGP